MDMRKVLIGTALVLSAAFFSGCTPTPSVPTPTPKGAIDIGERIFPKTGDRLIVYTPAGDKIVEFLPKGELGMPSDCALKTIGPRTEVLCGGGYELMSMSGGEVVQNGSYRSDLITAK
jgi:hypothetical protein